ncbi:thiamine phosphate synthase [Helicobacter himalayensis]|uniref:thiamine phosphate synthase n=1 Tax=Helicobacter himalayensis TaxID=1591088 RepID=UPI00082EE098|nr:thiamine phosphate synthase [Helicobacter himalayensis]
MQSYLITPNPTRAYLRDFPQILSTFKPNLAMFRLDSHNLENLDSEIFPLGLEFAKLCKKNGVLSFLNLPNITQIFQDTQTQEKLFAYFDGVHLKGIQRDLLPILRDLPKDFNLGFSAHSITELESALTLGAQYCTLSPIFSTPNKGAPLGIKTLLSLDSTLLSRIFALGGIDTPQKRTELESALKANFDNVCNLRGFASIRYFLNLQNI